MITTPDFRALCAELLDELQYQTSDGTAAELQDRARAALATPPTPIEQTSDGYHTFAELYEHRHALTLSLMKARPDLFWFSRRHNDGELCFGDGSWFILGAELPGAGGITYHLPMRLWDVATLTGATELEIGRHWDGHTAADVINRLIAWAITPPPEPPTDEELLGLWMGWNLGWDPEKGAVVMPHPAEYARAVLERWGNQATITQTHNN